MNSRCPIFLVGATGVGKSGAALELARADARFTGRGGRAILAMDAMQVYRGAEVGTGKPTVGERAEFPHGGLDLAEFGASFDVAQYVRHAVAFLREQREVGCRVIIVGGTGLYFRALTRGLCEAPRGAEGLRAELGSLSVAELGRRLRAVDPGMLARIDGANPRRLARAIEVMESTGRSLRDWQEETPEPPVGEYEAIWIQREKAELAGRIEARVEAMFAQGWVEEVRGLAERHGAEAVRGFGGIGYREIGEGIASGLLREEGQDVARARREVKSNVCVATRQYAKRQLTWFAREPSLQVVTLSGQQTLSSAWRASALPDLL